MIRKATVYLFLLCTLVGPSAVHTLAQSQTQPTQEALPLISLSSFEVGAGAPLGVTASNLAAGTSYAFSLTGPGGEERTETLEADVNGELETEFSLEVPGVWQLEVTGQNLDFSINVEVQDGPSATLDAPQSGAAAEAEQAEPSPDPGDAQDSLDNETLTPVPTPTDTPDASDDAASADPEGADSEGASDPDSGANSTEGAEENAAPGENATSSDAGPSSAGRDPLTALALSVGGLGWYSVLALLLAVAALHLTLTAKYWLPQSVNLERRRILGRRVSPLSRALAIRYYSLTEKLVFLLLFALIMIMAGLAAWYNAGGAEGWTTGISGVFQNPWLGLMASRPPGLRPAAWGTFVVLFLLAAAFTLAWVFIPRFRWAANAPRSWVYNVLSVLVPGSGLADEMWGLLLIVPWAFFSLDTLATMLGWGFGWGVSLRWDILILLLIYVVNFVAVAVEFMSYRRRMRALKENNPELAREFGLLRSLDEVPTIDPI